MNPIRIGTRESKLALFQAELVRDFINTQTDKTATLVPMKTTGDIILDRSLDKIGGKGLFVKELDTALLDGRSDLSVHSCKDLPMEVSEDLPIVGFSHRASPFDALVLPEGATIWDRTRPVGCSSRRRMLQLSLIYPDVKFEPVRGNLQTRLSKLDSGQYGALILACAGLERMELGHRISRRFTADEMIPAAGQGILCVQGVKTQNYGYLSNFFDPNATACAVAERAFVTLLDGGCSSPIAAYAEIEGDNIFLRGLYFDEATQQHTIGTATGLVQDAQKIGEDLAKKLKFG
ncbi:MAG: hydroxymethylbilane synthase [Eubacteriales bacterium]